MEVKTSLKERRINFAQSSKFAIFSKISPKIFGSALEFFVNFQKQKSAFCPSSRAYRVQELNAKMKSRPSKQEEKYKINSLEISTFDSRVVSLHLHIFPSLERTENLRKRARPRARSESEIIDLRSFSCDGRTPSRLEMACVGENRDYAPVTCAFTHAARGIVNRRRHCLATRNALFIQRSRQSRRRRCRRSTTPSPRDSTASITGPEVRDTVTNTAESRLSPPPSSKRSRKHNRKC